MAKGSTSTFEHVRLGYFVVSLAIGLLYVYVSTPSPRVVVQFPSPHNAGKILYRDRDNNCFKYDAQRVTCPADRSLVRPQPIVEDFVQKTVFPKNSRQVV